MKGARTRTEPRTRTVARPRTDPRGRRRIKERRIFVNLKSSLGEENQGRLTRSFFINFSND